MIRQGELKFLSVDESLKYFEFGMINKYKSKIYCALIKKEPYFEFSNR